MLRNISMLARYNAAGLVYVVGPSAQCIRRALFSVIPTAQEAVAFVSATRRHAKVRIAAIEALWTTVKVPDRAKVKGAGTSAIVDLVGFREDNVLPVAAFYGRGDTTVNYLAEVRDCRLS